MRTLGLMAILGPFILPGGICFHAIDSPSTPHTIRFSMWHPSQGIEFSPEFNVNLCELLWPEFTEEIKVEMEVARFSKVLERVAWGGNGGREKSVEMFEPLLIRRNHILDGSEGEFDV